jgi:hypothetical protein
MRHPPDNNIAAHVHETTHRENWIGAYPPYYALDFLTAVIY